MDSGSIFYGGAYSICHRPPNVNFIQYLEFTNSIFLELKYVFISNILTWLRHFTRCNRLGRAQVARHNEKIIITPPHRSHHPIQSLSFFPSHLAPPSYKSRLRVAPYCTSLFSYITFSFYNKLLCILFLITSVI